MRVERVDTVRCGLGEGAVWDSRDEALFFLDIFGKKVFRHDPASGVTHAWDTGGHVGAMALTEDGGAVLAMVDTLGLLDFESGEIERIAGPVFDGPNVVVNDGIADTNGRFLFGGCSAGMEGEPKPVGGLYALDPSGKVTQLDSGIYQSNGHCISPDGRTVYAADSHMFTMSAYDYDPQTGTVANKRTLIDTRELGGVPDGSTVDADGTVWISLFKAGKIAAVRPDGKLERTIDLPVKLISSVTFGGPGLDRLYVTTIDPTQFGWEAEEGSGHIYVVDGLGARGVPETRYRGTR